MVRGQKKKRMRRAVRKPKLPKRTSKGNRKLKTTSSGGGVKAQTFLKPGMGIYGPQRIGNRQAVLSGDAEVEVATGNILSDFYSPTETYSQHLLKQRKNTMKYFTATRGNNALIPINVRATVFEE